MKILIVVIFLSSFVLACGMDDTEAPASRDATVPATEAEVAKTVPSTVEEFLKATCTDSDKVIVTWGDFVADTEDKLERLDRLTIPEELREYHDDTLPVILLMLEFAKGQDADTQMNDGDSLANFQQSEEFTEALNVAFAAEEALDPELASAVSENPC